MSDISTLEKPNTKIIERIMQQSSSPEVMTSIYEENCNIAIWKRQLPEAFVSSIESSFTTQPPLTYSIVVNATSVEKDIEQIVLDREYGAQLREYIKQTVDMFCCLFEGSRVGLRLSTLNKAMCPRFHVDRVPCRLITTFCGKGTEWLAHKNVNRSKLGHGNGGKPDDKSGLFNNSGDINTLACGDVALLKGETWEGNEGAGLVHRSPPLKSNESRLLMTLDFIGD